MGDRQRTDRRRRGAVGGGPLEEIKAELDDDRLKEAVFSEGRQITIWYRIAECTPLRPKLHFFLK